MTLTDRSKGAIEDSKQLLQKARTFGISSKAAEHIPPVQWLKDGRASGERHVKRTCLFARSNSDRCPDVPQASHPMLPT